MPKPGAAERRHVSPRHGGAALGHGTQETATDQLLIASVKHNGVALALAGLAAYWIAMHWLGYIGPTFVFMVYLQWVVMADRRRLRVIATSVVVTAAIYLAFGQILNVPLPAI